MKSILLATTASFAFAGAAVAQETGVNFSGSATLGYNDNEDSAEDNNFGFYLDGSIDITGSTELDNGLTAGFSTGFDIVTGEDGDEDGIIDDMSLEASGYEVFVEGGGAGLYFGATDPAAEVNFSAVSGTEAGFLDQDGFLDDDGSEIFDDGAILRGEYATDMYAVALSYGVDFQNPEEPLVGLQLSASADVGPVTVALGYQQEDTDYGLGEVIGVSFGGTFAGADVKLSYVDEDGVETSTGVEVSYAISDMITVGGYYTQNDSAGDFFGISADYTSGPISVSFAYDDEDGDDTTALEGSYDVGNGIMAYAGYITSDDGDRFYIAGTYDLGGGAELLVSYAEDDDDADEDEIGANEYQAGTTIEVSFEF